MSMSSHERLLGTLALLFDLRPTRGRPILPDVEPGTPEFDCMLAALLFDVIKKRALTHRVLRKYMLHADPALTREILSDLRELDDAEDARDYEALMWGLHDQMNRAVSEVSEDHVLLAEIVERWSQGGPPDSLTLD